MDKDELIDSLKDPGPWTDRGSDCPQPGELAQFLDRTAIAPARLTLPAQRVAEIERHIADCSYCLDQVALVLGSRESPGNFAGEALLHRAEALASPQSSPNKVQHSRWNIAVPVAAAAALVLAVTVLFSQRANMQAVPPGADAFPTTRYADRQALNPRVLAPSEGSVIVPTEQVFRWTEVPGSRFYDVRLVDADGELVLRERVETTRWLIPQELQLRGGEEYFVRIDAYLDDAQFLSSEHVVFSVQKPE